ncbi:hypothetical protein A1704_23665 [Chryseobacterium cucumeris]|uniref:FISUMP domain-containing protein n=1 Tax=Chryseobacterium cucumeris TaxID=1813611 RepID=UPI00078824F1|nr:FISUMP domain-containing protein [Chryseobacterium cucumeris]KYH06601.1 hypothetical protein A1704_23665 [Chryseobacterium cucumeris]
MRTQILLLAITASFTALLQGQVGINTTSPKSTLDVEAKNIDGSSPEGIIAPRLTRNALVTASGTGQYGLPQSGAIIYVTEIDGVSSSTGQTANVDAVGYYYFDGQANEWKKLGAGSNIYNSNGTLSNNRIMNMNGNTLGFIQGRMGVGSATSHPSSILGLESTTLGFLPPRMTKAQMDAIINPSVGLIVYCTDCFANNQGCLMVNDSSVETSPKWGSLCSSNVSSPIVFSIDCASAVTSGSLYSGTAASGVSTIVPYNGGNDGTYNAVNFFSTGVTGLMASLPSGTLNTGNGNFVFNITGTPNSAGTANFDITIAGKSCSFSIPVTTLSGSVSSLNCGSAIFSPSVITQGTAYSGTMSLPYSGGNGQAYPQESFVQNGLTFTRPAGTLANGNGSLVYNVAGTASSAGVMSVPISFAGQSCSVNATVTGGLTTVMPGNPQAWMRHNLGADTSLDPDVPVQGIHGNYYQWGRAAVVADASTPSGVITSWNTTEAPTESWSDTSKTVNDPCPVGFRVPTRQQWLNLVNNTISSNIGAFNNSDTNFGSGKVLVGGGNKLTFPITGERRYVDGSLFARGMTARYWTSTEYPSIYGYNTYFDFGTVNASSSYAYKTSGYAVRCISE